MNKKYIILFVGVIVIFIIFVVVLVLQQTSQTATPADTTVSQNANSTSANRNTSQNIANSSLSPTPQEDAAQLVTREFYTYYFSYKVNPLANGAYKNSPYLSSDFKALIGSQYNNGNDPLFCPQNKRAKIVIGQEQQVPYYTTYLLQEIISEAPPGNQDLYTVLLKNIKGKWLIFDINCI